MDIPESTGINLPQLNLIGISIWDPVWALKDHVNRTHEIVHVLDGTVVLVIGSRKYAGQAGDTLIIPAGSKHRDEFDLANQFKVLHLQFEWAAEKPALKPVMNKALMALSRGGKEELKEGILRLYSIFLKNRQHAPQRTALLLLDLLYTVFELTTQKKTRVSSAGQKKKEQLIQQAKGYIHAHLQEHISLGTIAAELKLSEYYLSRLFSEETGFSLFSYLTKARMEAAAALLQDATMRVAEAAYAAGYEDPNYFSKVFRKYHGCSPSVYRAQAQRKG